MASQRLKRLRAYQAAVVAVLVGYVLIATIPRDEIFPFFDWDLFSNVPHTEGADYGLRVIAVDGEELAEPLFLEETEGMFPLARSPTAHHIVQSLGAALRREDESDVQQALALVETNLLEPHSVTFEIVFRDYDIVERARFRRFIRVEELGLFETGASP